MSSKIKIKANQKYRPEYSVQWPFIKQSQCENFVFASYAGLISRLNTVENMILASISRPQSMIALVNH